MGNSNRTPKIPEYWLIAVPLDGQNSVGAFDKMNDWTSKKRNLCRNYKFDVPQLKSGSFDEFVGLGDELAKLDTAVEQMVHHLATYMDEVLLSQNMKLQPSLLVNGRDLPTYMKQFRWDAKLYPTHQKIRKIAESIKWSTNSLDSELRSRSATYNEVRSAALGLDKKKTGGILTSNWNAYVRKEDVLPQSEHLTMLLVGIQRLQEAEFKRTYETLVPNVVPRSARLLVSDTDYCVFSLILFTKVVDRFKGKAREYKYMVREYVAEAEKNDTLPHDDKELLDRQFEYLLPQLLQWLKSSFSECFVAWMHVKALRIFVEATLRYGLPAKFQAILVEPKNESKSKKLRKTLNQLYAKHGCPTIDYKKNPNLDIMSAGGVGVFNNLDFYPYVNLKISMDMKAN